MALKRELSQASAGSPPARKAPRLTLAVHAPSSPEPLSTAPTTVVSPTDDDHVPSPPFLAAPHPIPRAPFGAHLDPAQLVACLEDLAEEYERSVDEMGAEIEELRRQVSVAQRALYATPSLESCGGPSLTQQSLAGIQPADGIDLPGLDTENEASVSATGAGLKAEALLPEGGEGDGVEGDGDGENEDVAGSLTA